MKLSKLFHKCAYDISYQQAGEDVNYAFEEQDNTLYIYFQGSSQVTDWIRNFLFKKRPYKDMEIPYRVHRGFLAAWKEIEDIIIAKVTEHVIIDNGTVFSDPEASFNSNAAPLTDYKWKNIVIVGYSHGGALAGLCHECVWFWRPDLREEGLVGYGFEAPRFYGGYKVRPELKERWAHFYVIRDGNDVVTHCPPSIFRYCHVGEIINIEGSTSFVESKWIPKCVKYHFPQVVYDGLLKYEKELDK